MGIRVLDGAEVEFLPLEAARVQRGVIVVELDVKVARIRLELAAADGEEIESADLAREVIRVEMRIEVDSTTLGTGGTP